MFYLFPWVHREGNFNTMDIAIFILVIWFVYIVFFKKKLLINFFSVVIIFLLFFVGFHIPYAMIQYGIDFKDAFIASRVFLLYLSYYMFLDLFKDDKAIHHFMKWIMVMAIFSILTGFVNYFGPKILYHETATVAGARMRGGIIRAYFPAYWMVVFASIYSCTIFITSERIKGFPLMFFIISIGTIVFRQTRMVIGAYALVICSGAIKRLSNPRVLVLILFGFIGIISVLINIDKFEIVKLNIMKTEQELSDSSGSWGGRVEQFKTAWELIKEGFIFGTGSSALRSNAEAYNGMPLSKVRSLLRYSLHSDLGYAVWFKNFGLVGLVLLIFIGTNFVKKLKLMKKSNKIIEITNFAQNYLLYVSISFITLNHLGHSDGILLITCIMAMLQSSVSNVKEVIPDKVHRQICQNFSNH